MYHVKSYCFDLMEYEKTGGKNETERAKDLNVLSTTFKTCKVLGERKD